MRGFYVYTVMSTNKTLTIIFGRPNLILDYEPDSRLHLRCRHLSGGGGSSSTTTFDDNNSDKNDNNYYRFNERRSEVDGKSNRER